MNRRPGPVAFALAVLSVGVFLAGLLAGELLDRTDRNQSAISAAKDEAAAARREVAQERSRVRALERQVRSLGATPTPAPTRGSTPRIVVTVVPVPERSSASPRRSPTRAPSPSRTPRPTVSPTSSPSPTPSGLCVGPICL